MYSTSKSFSSFPVTNEEAMTNRQLAAFFDEFSGFCAQIHSDSRFLIDAVSLPPLATKLPPFVVSRGSSSKNRATPVTATGTSASAPAKADSTRATRNVEYTSSAFERLLTKCEEGQRLLKEIHFLQRDVRADISLQDLLLAVKKMHKVNEENIAEVSEALSQLGHAVPVLSTPLMHSDTPTTPAPNAWETASTAAIGKSDNSSSILLSLRASSSSQIIETLDSTYCGSPTRPILSASRVSSPRVSLPTTARPSTSITVASVSGEAVGNNGHFADEVNSFPLSSGSCSTFCSSSFSSSASLLPSVMTPLRLKAAISGTVGELGDVSRGYMDSYDWHEGSIHLKSHRERESAASGKYLSKRSQSGYSLEEMGLSAETLALLSVNGGGR